MNDKMTTDSISDKIGILKETDGALMKIIYRDKSGKPLAAAIFVNGIEETMEVLNTIDTIEQDWSS